MTRILYMTDSPNLCSTVRILQGWLPLSQSMGLRAHVVAPPGSKLLPWLLDRHIAHTADPMPWPNRLWPFPGLWHGWRVARWARRCHIDVIHCNEHNIYPFAVL